MLEEYDIDKLNPRPNPYAKELNKQVTVKIAEELDELDKMVALRGLMKDLDRAKARADREGWIDADEAERILQ